MITCVENENVHTFWSENVKKEGHLRDTEVKVILKLMLEQ
jgi:hypothetical protein